MDHDAILISIIGKKLHGIHLETAGPFWTAVFISTKVRWYNPFSSYWYSKCFEMYLDF